MKLRIFFLTLIFILILQFTCYGMSITCSLFPVYDFAREIAGDEADVHLLLKPGVEPHEFEPTPLDIKILSNSDVFIFTGEQMEQWATRLPIDKSKIIDASEGIEIFNNDPHIWLDLNNAQRMVKNIADGLSKTMPEKSEIFNLNAENFCEKLAELDEKFVSLNKNKTLIFAGEFAFNYFVRRYGFDFISAYDGENEPSIKRMAEILKFIKDNNAKFILADSFEISAITKSIAEQTGTEILFFDSCEKISQKSFESGLTFLKIMQANYEALRKFIND